MTHVDLYFDAADDGQRFRRITPHESKLVRILRQAYLNLLNIQTFNGKFRQQFFFGSETNLVLLLGNLG